MVFSDVARSLLTITSILLLAACGPVWRVPGGRLSGTVVTDAVADWSFTDEIQTIAVEVRPSFPHSVTTWCFAHGGELYVPAGGPAAKKWPEWVRQNPSVRLEIEGKIYPGRFSRIIDRTEKRRLLGSLAAKYRLTGLLATDDLPDVALYRFEHTGSQA